MGTGNAGKVTGSLWRKCSEPHTTENESGPIRFEREMGIPICVHRLKVYLFTFTPKFFEFGLFAIPNFAKKGPKRQAHIRDHVNVKTPREFTVSLPLLHLIAIYTLCFHYAHAAANLNSGYLIRESSALALFLYNGSPNIWRSADVSVA